MWGNKRSIIIFFSIVILYSFHFYAQVKNIRLGHITIEQGLSQSTVNCIAQDSTGFLWFGTQDGLDRYDGYSFQVYKPVPDNFTSISDNYIECIFVDRLGIMWVGTDNGLNRYNSFNDTFTTFQNKPDDQSSISSNYITSISGDRNNNLWIGTNNGLDCLDRSKNKFIRYFHNKKDIASLISDTVYSTFTDSKGRLWIGTARGLDLFESKSKGFKHYIHNPKDKNSIIASNIYSIAEDKSGNLWIGTYRGLDKLDIRSGVFTHYIRSASNASGINSDSINVVYVDRNGTIWVGTDNDGLIYLNPETGRFTTFENKVVKTSEGEDKGIYSLLEDKEGLLWIGTSTSGVFKYDGTESSFGLIRVEEPGMNIKEENDVCSIIIDHHNNLWYGTFSSGVIKLNEKTGKFVHYLHTNSSNSISQNNINAVIEDRSGFIWISTAGGLDRLNPETNTFVHFKHNPKNQNSLSDNYVNTITMDNSGNLWIAYSGEGMDKFEPALNKFTHFRHIPGNSNSLSNNEVNYLFFDNSGTLWIGTNGSGIDRMDVRTGRFRHYTHEIKNPNSLCNDFIFDIFQNPNDTTGVIWIGTSGGGFSRLNTRTNQFKNYSEAEGLANNEVYGILGDKNGNLWLSTNDGISKFNIKNETFHNYNRSDGLQSNEFNQGAFFQSMDGKMYFGGIKGINAFYPDSIIMNSYNPNVVFTSFKDFIKPLKSDSSIWESPELHLGYREHILSFKFAALSYNDPQKNHFAYKLKGLDNEWIDNGTSNTVTFASLSPGRYRLLIKGTNNDGTWSRNVASLNIIIAPPFSGTWWFRTILLGALIALIFLIFKLRLRSVQVRNKRLAVLVSQKTNELNSKKEELEEINYKQSELLNKLMDSEKELKGLNQHKDKIISVLAHDLRSPFNGLLGYTEMLANDVEQMEARDIKLSAKNINYAANNLFKLLNNLLEWSLVQAGRIKYSPAKENLLQSVDEVIHLLKINAEQKSISLKEEIDGAIHVWADRDMLDIILRNLISNAIKFTPNGGEVLITSKSNNGTVEIGIRDNGIGMDENVLKHLLNPDSRISTRGTNNESGTGLGLNLCKELIIKQGGNIRLESKAGEGTLVSFTLPRSKNH